MNIKEFWKDVLEQNKEKLQNYFHENAVIRWHCSNELFTVSEYKGKLRIPRGVER